MLNQAKLAQIKKKIVQDPSLSLSKLGKITGVSKATAGKAVKDLGYYAYVCPHRQIVSTSTKATRVAKGKKLLAWMKKHPSVVLVFSDEKYWTVGNDRRKAKVPKDLPPINRSKHPAGAMMLGIVTSDGKSMPLHSFPK